MGRRVEERIRRWTRSARVLLTPSGSAALEMAFTLLRLEPEDEVILPSFAFVSDANAVLRAGGRPVFAEIDEATLNLDPEDVRRRITSRTRAILPVHYGGRPCRMDALGDLCRGRRVAIVEDAAHAYGGTHRGRPLGGIGAMGIFSFHETKDFSCGEGGALTVGRKDLVGRAEILQEKGTDRGRFLRGEVPRYVWRDVGSSYLLSDVLAAILEVRLRRTASVLRERRRIWETYREGLAPLADGGELILPPPPEAGRQACHLFWIRTRSERKRRRIMEGLRSRGIEATFHFVPLHTSPFGRKLLGGRRGDLPVTERVARTLIRLPLYPSLGTSGASRVVRAARQVMEGR
jgi:dTDP-4-amino-4,6-dideoxygalactose transaminase